MTMLERFPELETLSRPERLQLVQELHAIDLPPLPPDLVEELRRGHEEYRRNPESGIPLEVFRERFARFREEMRKKHAL